MMIWCRTDRLQSLRQLYCLQDPSEYITKQIFTDATATVHESYTSCCAYDIAVIRLPTPLRYNDYVQPVCLPSSPAAVGTNCVATGWGATKGKQNSKPRFWPNSEQSSTRTSKPKLCTVPWQIQLNRYVLSPLQCKKPLKYHDILSEPNFKILLASAPTFLNLTLLIMAKCGGRKKPGTNGVFYYTNTTQCVWSDYHVSRNLRVGTNLITLLFEPLRIIVVQLPFLLKVDIIHSSYYIHGPWRATKNFCCFISVSYGPYTLLQNDSFFTFIFAVFLLNLFCGCILLHKPIYGVAALQKRTEAILEYYLRFQFGNRRY